MESCTLPSEYSSLVNLVSLCERGVNAQEALGILIRVNQSGEGYAFRNLTGNFAEEETFVNANRGAVFPHSRIWLSTNKLKIKWKRL